MGALTTDMEAPADARRERMIIGGADVDAIDGRTFAVEAPARRGSVVAMVPRRASAAA